MTMSRAPVFPVEEKVRVVLSILAGELSVAEAARRAKVSEQSVGNWKRQFLEAGRAGLVAGKAGPTTREAQLEAEVADLTQADYLEVLEGPSRPSADLFQTRSSTAASRNAWVRSATSASNCCSRVDGPALPATREQQLEAEVADLTQALGEAAVELRVWKKSVEGRLGPSRTSRFCALIGMPE